MDARRDLSVPAALQERVRTLTHDIQRAKLNLAEGRLKPDQYGALSRILDARMRDLEADVHALLLHDARVGRVGGWKPKGGGS